MASQLIIQNMYATEWYFADEAQVYKSEYAWMVYAKRLSGSDDTDINWTIMPSTHNKTLQWIEGMAHVDNDETGAGVLALDAVDRVRLVTFSSTVGQKLEYVVRMRDGHTRTLYSWMGNFVDAWNTGFQSGEYPGVGGRRPLSPASPQPLSSASGI